LRRLVILNKDLLINCEENSKKYLWLAQDYATQPQCPRKDQEGITMMRTYIQLYAKSCRFEDKKKGKVWIASAPSSSKPTFLMPMTRYLHSPILLFLYCSPCTPSAFHNNKKDPNKKLNLFSDRQTITFQRVLFNPRKVFPVTFCGSHRSHRSHRERRWR